MPNKFQNVHKWHERLRRTCSNEEIVEDIKRRMEAERDLEIVRTLALILASEFREQQRYGAAENISLDLSQKDPIEPYPLINLAEQKLYYEQKIDEALEIVDEAIKRARACGNFHRNALGVKARIAEKMRRYDLIADVMKEIMTIEYRRVDVGVERDFVDRLPPGAIDAELVEKYNEFCRRAARK
jgi:tetratricopeptide (TPR) repeat protein